MKKVNRQKALYENIMKEIAPQIRKTLNEATLDEGLFGIGDPSKPSAELTADYIRDHSQEEIADLFHQYSIYFMAKQGQNVDNAVTAFMEKTKSVWASMSESADEQKKTMGAIIASVKASITGKYESTKKFAKAIPGHIVFGIATLIKLGVNGWDSAEAALKNMYSSLASFLQESYKALTAKVGDAKDGLDKKYNELKETIALYMKVAGAVLVAVANQLKGAKEAFGAWLSKIAEDAKAGVLFAVSIVREWFAVKAEAVAKFVATTYGSAKAKCIEVWNSFSGTVVKAWKNACAKVTEFVDSVKATMEKIGEKIADFAEATKQGAISLKDAGAAKIISKTVKALNKDNYPLDKVIDLVTKAYNESVYVENGEAMLNEGMFNKKVKGYVKLYESYTAKKNMKRV